MNTRFQFHETKTLLGGQNMLVFACDRDTVIDVGSSITVRVVSIGRETVELEIDATGDIRLEPDVIFMDSESRRGADVSSFT
jgi:hypothetical protein